MTRNSDHASARAAIRRLPTNRGQGVAGSALLVISGLVLAAFYGPVLAQEPVEFTDGSFSPADWEPVGPFTRQSDPLDGDPESDFQLHFEAEGGNPGQFVRISQRLPGIDAGDTPGTSTTDSYGLLFKTTAVYDPAEHGEIERIDFSWNSRYAPIIEAGIRDLSFAAVTLAVEQGGHYWAALDPRLFVRAGPQANWTALELAGLRLEDFRIGLWREEGQQTRPDFSATGLPITFGFAQGTSCGYTGINCGGIGSTLGAQTDLDNWHVSIHPCSPAGDGAGQFGFTADEIAVLETDGTVEIEVERTCGTLGEAELPYRIDAQEFDNPAVQLVDYRHPPGEATQSDIGALSFADGETRKSIAVEILDNGLVDGERRFAITLQQPSAGALREPERTLVTIIDDDAGTDVGVVSLTLTRIKANVDFAGLTAGFNELRHRFQVKATIQNFGPLPVSGLVLVLDLPKLHLAGFGQQPGGKCSIPVLDPPDPEFVKVVCSGLDELAPGATLELPDLGLYVGYARTIPDNLQVEYFAWLETSLASVPDFNLDNNLRSELISPRTHDKSGGGGSLSPPWLLLFALALLANARRRRGQAIGRGR